MKSYVGYNLESSGAICNYIHWNMQNIYIHMYVNIDVSLQLCFVFTQSYPRVTL